MTKLANFRKSVKSIFRKRKVAPKQKKDGFNDVSPKDDSVTVSLEESESYTSLNDSTSSLFSTVAEVSTADVLKSKKTQDHVSFGQVTIRHYDLILGDNPYIKYPLSLGWTYSKEEVRDVDLFESQREERESRACRERIQPRLYLPPTVPLHYMSDVHTEQDYDDAHTQPVELNLYERRARLRAFGYTEAVLRQLERHRLVTLALEWKEEGTPSFPFSRHFIARYTK